MRPPKPPTPGLRRAFLRDALRNRRNWTALLTLTVVIALLALAFIRVPARVDFLPARIDSITQTESDYGTRPAYTATTDAGRFFPLVTPNRLTPLLPPGARICLRVQTDRFTGRVTARHAVENPDCRPMPET